MADLGRVLQTLNYALVINEAEIARTFQKFSKDEKFLRFLHFGAKWLYILRQKFNKKLNQNLYSDSRNKRINNVLQKYDYGFPI